MNTYRLPPIQLAEAQGNGLPGEVQLLRVGEFRDARYGKFQVTPKMLAEMVKNHDEDVRRIRVMIDFAHKTDEEAAAWVKKLSTKNGGSELWATVDWTGPGSRLLTEKAYGYISADFNENYVDNESGKKFGCVLLGAGLTNRPVVKGMQPVIQLSEAIQGDAMTTKKLSDLSPEDLGKIGAMMEEMGVSSVEDFMAKISEMRSKAGSMAAAETKLMDVEKKLSEATKTISTFESEKKLSEKTEKFNKLLAEGKACPAQKEAYLAGDMEKFTELAPKGGVKFSEAGTEVGGEDETGDDSEKVRKLAEEKVKDKSAKNIPDAISMVLKENPNLKYE